MPVIGQQASFVGGEIAPTLHARVDLARYLTALKGCRNFIVQKHGGAVNRPGFGFVAEIKDSSRKAILVPFAFSPAQTYMMEFGHHYVRFYSAGGVVLNSLGAPVEVETPYEESDLPLLRTVQSADVVTIVHPLHAPAELKRLDHDVWTISPLVVAPSISPPALPVWTSGELVGDSTHVSKDWQWVVTAIRAGDDGDESVASAVVNPNNVNGTNAAVYADKPHRISWGAVTGAAEYNVYRGRNGIFGYIGTTPRLYFDDDGQAPSYQDTPPKSRDPFASAGNFPGCATYFEGRFVAAGALLRPQTVEMSQSGSAKNFDAASPANDDDAVSFTVQSNQVDAVRALVSSRVLLVLTSAAEYVVSGGQNGVITPSSIDARAHSYYGCAELEPLVVGRVALFVQAKGAAVRDLFFDYEADGYGSNDLSVMASHLFAGQQIVDWCYAQEPHSVVWAVRDDGALLGMTYLREHEVWGWHRHDTDGAFESVASVAEGSEDAVYCVVRRTINGQTKRYVERMASRRVTDARLGMFLDSGLGYDGRNTTARTMTLSGSVWTAGSAVEADASPGDFFTVQDVGATIVFDHASGPLRARILSVLSGAAATVQLEKDAPPDLQGTAVPAWSLARQIFTNLDHLEGKSVSVLADGNVLTPCAVSAGRIETDVPGAVVKVGLPYVCDLEALEINVPADRKKTVSRVILQVENSRGSFVGEDFDHLVEWKQRRIVDSYEPSMPLATDRVEIAMKHGYRNNGGFVLRHVDPLPLNVLAMTPDLGVSGG